MKGKLPDVAKIRRMLSAGMTQREIAKVYDTTQPAISKRLAYAAGYRQNEKSIGRAFLQAGKDPIEHRHTGEGIGFGLPSRLHFTTLDDCSDLLRERGLR